MLKWNICYMIHANKKRIQDDKEMINNCYLENKFLKMEKLKKNLRWFLANSVDTSKFKKNGYLSKVKKSTCFKTSKKYKKINFLVKTPGRRFFSTTASRM